MDVEADRPGWTSGIRRIAGRSYGDHGRVTNTVNEGSGSLDLGRDEREPMRRALETLHPSAFCWALHCCHGERSEAEDVLHDVYLKILQGRARFAGQSSFKTWLFAVIRTTARETRRLLLRRIGLLTRAASAPPPESPDPCRELSQRDESERLRAALRRLPERQCEVARLVFYHDLTVEEASRVMGVSLGSARVHYERAKKRLRQELRPPEGEHA